MTKDEKFEMINSLTEKLKSSNIVYLADAAGLSVGAVNSLRRSCFNSGIEMQVVKNTLLQKAMENIEGRDYSELYPVLNGPTAILISEVANAPAKLIQEFRKKSEKPVLKGAWIDEATFVGDSQLKTLAELKSKEELVGEVLGMLLSPAQNVISALQSGGNTIAGVVKTLSER